MKRNRNDWGTYSKTSDFSDISTIPIIRCNHILLDKYDIPKKYVSVDEMKKDVVKDDVMTGSGFLDTLKEKLKSIPKYASKASDLYSSDVGTALRNMIPASDSNARPAFAGEKHAILSLPNGKNGTANFMGPGTQVIKRLRRGDVGRTPSDNVAKRHDIDYVLAAGEKTKEGQLTKIREADNRMIKSLQKIRENKTDSQRNIQMGMRLIQAKKFGEDVGLLDKSKFAGDLSNINESDKILLENERNKSEQNGYGADGKLLPGQKLKLMLLKQQLKGSGAGSYPSMSKDLSKKGYVLKGGKKGKGLILSGGKIDIMSILKTDVIPKLLSTIKLNIPSVEINKLLDKHLSGNINKDSIMGLAADMLPTLISYKLKQVKLNPVELVKKGIVEEAIKGSGLKLAGQGLKLAGQGKKKRMKMLMKMKGLGILDNISDLMGPMKDIAIDALYKGLMEVLKNVLKGSSGNGLSLPGAGAIMTGSGFWSDFIDGFKTGFVRTLDLLTLPIKLLAPELVSALDIGKEVGKILPGKMLF